MTRAFTDTPAVRERVPLLIGLVGPSGSGKTYSALRLATGIQRVSGGDIFVIDTEARRALHYADKFKFRHLQFDAPFGSLDYLAALRHCVSAGAGVVVVDSLSHEHQGPGGYLLTQEAELERMAGDDYAKRERAKFAAWIKPSGMRKQLIDGMMQLQCNFVFCFRAREKTKPVPGKPPVEMGFSAISGEEFLYEMTVRCLLMPKSDGVPTWLSNYPGEREAMKLPGQFEAMFKGGPLDEATGEGLAQWAKGGASPNEPDYGAMAHDAARKGVNVFRDYWKSLPQTARSSLRERLTEFQKIAESAELVVQQSAEEGAAEDFSPASTAAPDFPSEAEIERSQTAIGAILLADLRATGEARAKGGLKPLQEFLDGLNETEADLISPYRKALVAAAAKAGK